MRVRGDELLLTDGPFAETKEQIGGFVLIECADLDEAIEIAAQAPGGGVRHDRDPAGAGEFAAGVTFEERRPACSGRSGARWSPR